MCHPCMKRILRKNLNCKFYFKLFFRDQNNSKFNISHNLSLKCVKASSLNSTHLRFPIVSKACPNFHKKNRSDIIKNFFQKVNKFQYPAHQHLSKNTKGTFQFLKKIQLRFNLTFSAEIIQYSRTFAPQVQRSWNQAHAPLLVESFPKTPRTLFEASWFGVSHNYKTKQNKTNYILHI